MPKLRSTASRIVVLHIIAVALTAVFMPLVLFWLLNRETDSPAPAGDGGAGQDHRARPLGLARWTDALALTPALKAQFSEAYGRYFYAVLDPAGKVLFSSEQSATPIFPPDDLAPPSEIREVEREHKIILGVSIPSDVDGQPVVIQVGEDLAHRDVLTDDIVANFFKHVGWITLRFCFCC